ncbi:unnamed protein product, partial [Polarella glacialis]
MGGVHASCVEAWVKCHRRSGAPLSAPCCPVCQTPFRGGQERAPGPRVLARQLTRSLGRQLLLTALEASRFVVLGTLLVHYRPLTAGFGARPDGFVWRRHEANRWLRVSSCIAGPALLGFMLHTLGVLLYSLPLQRAPPQSRLARHLFFTTDLWRLARHVAELLATVILLGGRCACGDLPAELFAPIGLLGLTPVFQLLVWYKPAACCREAAVALGCLISAPVLLVVEVGRLAWSCRARLVNPRDGPLHVLLALVACMLCLCRSQRAVYVLFSLHGALLALGLAERLAQRRSRRPFVGCCSGPATFARIFLFSRQARPAAAPDERDLPQRRRWQPGKAWRCALVVALEAASLCLEQRWLTLLLLLAALRALQRSAMEPPPAAVHGIGALLLHGPLWWCTLLVGCEACSLLCRELRH